jgi:hypothetical protein
MVIGVTLFGLSVTHRGSPDFPAVYCLGVDIEDDRKWLRDADFNRDVVDYFHEVVA